MNEMSDLQSLISMGFSKERAEEALFETKNAGIELALEYLLITNEIDNDENNKQEGCAQEPEEPFFHSHFAQVVDEVTSKVQAIDVSKISVNSNNKTRILVRLLNGETLSKAFNSEDQLNEVLLWIQSYIPSEHFDLMTTFPKKLFSEKDYQQSLVSLNLVPSAVVIVTQSEKWNDLQKYREETNDEKNRAVEEKRRKEEVEKRFKEMEEERSALERVRSQIEDDKADRRQRWPNLYKNSNQPSGNRLLQNQSRALLARNNKKFE